MLDNNEGNNAFRLNYRTKERIKFYRCLAVLIIIILLMSCGGKQPKYKTGDTVLNAIFKNLNNDELIFEKGPFNVILYSKYLDDDIALVRYVNNIYLNKYKNVELNILLVAHSINKNIDSIKSEHDISFPVLPLDKNKKVLQRFIDIGDSDRALIMINREMILESIYYFFTEDDIRQLLEKYLTGTITYSSDIKIKKMEVGETFPEVSITQLNQMEGKTVTNSTQKAPHLWFMFSSKCVTCALKNYLLQYKLLEKKLHEKVKIPAGLLFSHFFQEEQIIDQIKSYKISTGVYLAGEEIKGFESGYYKNASLDNIVVVLTDKINTIIYMESLPDFVMQFEGGDFEQILSSL